MLAVVQECIFMHLIGMEPQQLNALALTNALWPFTPANSKALVKCKVRGCQRCSSCSWFLEHSQGALWLQVNQLLQKLREEGRVQKTDGTPPFFRAL